jgi:hypothetical protein
MFLLSMVLFACTLRLPLVLLSVVLLTEFWLDFLVAVDEDGCGVDDDEIKVLLLTEWWIFNVDGFCLPLLGNVLLFERECFLFVEDREAARNIQIVLIGSNYSNSSF